MLVGKILRSPHAHARIKSIDTSKAEALPGVKAVVTRDDFPDLASELVPAGEMMINYRDMARNIMAREKVLYEGHPVAAVAATSAVDRQAGAQADRGRVRGAAARDRRGRGDAPGRAAPARRPVHRGRRAGADKPSNVAERVEFAIGDIEAGFAEADVDRRARVRHQAGAPGLHRAARLRRERGRGRPGGALVLRPRGTSSSAPTAPSCSASTSPRSASPRPRSAAASAARPWSISSRWRSRSRARRISR